MIKVFVLIKRREGTSMEDFIANYEKSHSVNAAKLVPSMKKYVRHYLHPYGTSAYAVDDVSACDVVTEVWYENRDAFEQAMNVLTKDVHEKTKDGDKEGLFERSSIRYYVVEDHETDFGDQDMGGDSANC